MFLMDEYRKDFKQAERYVTKNKSLICILHHSNEAEKVDDIYVKSNMCQKYLLTREKFNKELQILAALGLLYVYTDDTCALSQLGRKLLNQVDKKRAQGHAISVENH
jgi:hypothetical protein